MRRSRVCSEKARESDSNNVLADVPANCCYSGRQDRLDCEVFADTAAVEAAAEPVKGKQRVNRVSVEDDDDKDSERDPLLPFPLVSLSLFSRRSPRRSLSQAPPPTLQADSCRRLQLALSPPLSVRTLSPFATLLRAS